MSVSVHLARERSLYRTHTTRARETAQREIAGLHEQMTTGRRINRASDDAGAYGRARKLDALTDRYARYERSIEAARPWVTHTQDRLDQMGELLQQAHEQGVRGANDTFSASDREDFARSVEALRDELIDGLNARVGDEYLFAGNRTATKPFDDDPASATYGRPAVGYPAIAGARTRDVGPGLDLALNVDGETLHRVDLADGTTTTLTESLDELAAALRDPEGATPPLEEALGRLEQARDHVVRLGSRTGAVANRLDHSADQLERSTIEIEARRSELEDADYMETITDFQEQQNRLQAALQVSASVMQTSLLDYLR